MSKISNYECPKCGNTGYEADQFAATGGGLSKFLDIQTKKFTTVSCTKCKYTEIFKAEMSMLSNIFDFFT
ncbi:zinc ribbon domain-containing protein [Halonatronum saccharophilum]|uniref:zinc ribbon domain-containing protein n=1 Tax=Halonatronum saccharophilum TaxID=150060 RepID=UPI0004859118|nr:zinc ribbon domain-containing protein [Halonatronum saccharophilum]